MKPAILILMLTFEAMIVYGQGRLTQKNAQDTVPKKIDSLQAVIVTATMRPKLKGDTLEYNTEHILMRPNAVVEELLRRLPGLEVDANGIITYNGEKIQHLLVDGEDIFGSDPTLITRNFDASKIARVQILDRKSDQARFTGIDDGTRTKTLNLVLKESANGSYFGKAEAGGNLNGYYNANGILTAFRRKEQFALLGLASNTGVLGFSNSTGGSPAGLNFSNGSTDPLGTSAGIGIPRFAGGAIHYSNSWNQGNHLMGNYQYSSYYTNPMTTTQSRQFQPNSIYGQNQQAQSVNKQIQHLLFGIYDWIPNATTDFHFILRGNNSGGQNQFAATGISTFNDTLVNDSRRTIQDRVDRRSLGGDMFWTIKSSSRIDQAFTAFLGFTKAQNTTSGYLYSLNRFYQANGNVQSVDTTDQRKQISNNSTGLNSSVNFAEPLSRVGQLGLSYGIEYNWNSPLQATYARGSGKYEELIDSLTSSFATRIVNQHVTINLQGKVGALSYTIGNDWLSYSYRQQDVRSDSSLHLNFFNLAPRVRLKYSSNQTSNFNFNYSTAIQRPTMDQLNPVLNNNDPLHITLGNPTLRPGVNESFRLDYQSIKSWMIGATAIFSLIGNAISLKTTTDSLGRQVSQPVNVGGGSTGSLNFSIGRKLGGIDINLHTFSGFSRTINYVNALLARNDAFTEGTGINLSKYVDGKYSVYLNANISYLDQISSINSGTSIYYWTQSHQGSVTLLFIPNFEINTNAVYTWQQKTSAFAGNTSVLLWNAYVSRNFLHDKLEGRFQFNNILNANAGITRTNVANVNTQTSTNILGRYWMLSAVYHFDKKFKRK